MLRKSCGCLIMYYFHIVSSFILFCHMFHMYRVIVLFCHIVLSMCINCLYFPTIKITTQAIKVLKDEKDQKLICNRE